MPREGHDSAELNVLYINCYFNPRAPRGARHRFILDFLLAENYFNPRAPRGARQSTPENSPGCFIYFNPRAPRGARLRCEKHIGDAGVISIHVPREGHDQCTGQPPARRLEFQSTCPAKGTTACNTVVTAPIAPFQSTCPARGTTTSLASLSPV